MQQPCMTWTQTYVGFSGGDFLGQGVEFYLYPTVGTVLIHSIKPELTE